MPVETWLLFAGTVILFMATPGPSHLLMFGNSLASGFRRAWPTGAGDLTANLLQMLAAGLGLAALVSAAGSALLYIKLAGAVYLIWLGVRMIQRAGDVSRTAPEGMIRGYFWQGFLTSASNPKAIAFFAALFPQFISPDLAFAPQFLALSATYLVIDGIFLTGWGLFAGVARSRFGPALHKRLVRAGGGIIVLTGCALGLRTLAGR